VRFSLGHATATWSILKVKHAEEAITRMDERSVIHRFRPRVISLAMPTQQYSTSSHRLLPIQPHKGLLSPRGETKNRPIGKMSQQFVPHRIEMNIIEMGVVIAFIADLVFP
jgi:hypothetical protein